MADRCDGPDQALAQHYADAADTIAPAFASAFWNEQDRCLYDCICVEAPDRSIRPNQIFAVSLPYSPLSADRQTAVVDTVREHLLTPLGLRTLSPQDPDYHGRYEGDLQQRDRAYHQGTVWAWLIGPFIEAYLKVNAGDASAPGQAAEWLAGLDAHIPQAGVGYVSEIFDGDPPHRHDGCIAQAWSVAELLRAKLLVEASLEESRQ